MIDPWEAAGHDPPVDPFPGSGSWDVCVVGSKFDKQVEAKRLYGWQVARMLAIPQITLRKDQVPLWMPIRVKPREDGTLGKRTEDVESISMFVVDSDSGIKLDVLMALGRTEDYDLLRFGHTSYSHTAAKTKGRVVFPLTEPVPVSRWEAVWEAGTRWAAACGVVNDPATKNPSRLWYNPSAPRAEDFFYWRDGGTKEPSGARLWNGQALLDPAWLIRTYPKPAAKARRNAYPARAPGGGASSEVRGAALARSWLNARLARLGQIPPGGGQSMYVYGFARKVAQAVTSGVVSDPDWWLEQCVWTAASVGLDEKRARGDISNGYKKGQAEVWQELIDAVR